MTAKEVMKKLESLGSEAGKNVYMNHGANGKCFGVRVADLKLLLKQIKNEQQLAMELYDTGYFDAMYLAGLVADGAKMTKEQIQDWAEKAHSFVISEYTVPWVAAESPWGHELALEWMASQKEHIACAGWNTMGTLVAVKEDAELDMKALKALLDKVTNTIHEAPNRVRYSMNGFVIALGVYVSPLTAAAAEAAKKIGAVKVNMGDTYCKVPFAPDYIKKVKDAGRIGKKRKTFKC